MCQVVDLDRRLAVIAAGQHSLVTMRDVSSAGGTRRNAHERVQSGRWVRVHSGVFRLAGVPFTYESRVMALVLAAGAGAVASHMCAARLLGLGFTNAPPEVSIPRGRRHRQPGVRVHESTDLDRCDVHTISGIPVTDPARTLLDVGRYLGPAALGRAVEQARRRNLVTWPDLIRCLVDHARQGRHGIRRLRLVIASGMTIDEVTDTDSELIALTLLREHGFPEPTLHHRIYDGSRLVAELDLAYVDQLVDIEIDGDVHLAPEVRQKDDARDHELRRLGWTVRRVWRTVPVNQPTVFLRIVRGLLNDAASRDRS